MRYARLKKLTKAVVVVFDMVSSTRIVESLNNAHRLEPFEQTLEKLKHFIAERQVIDGEIQVDPYKFTGDGWILLFRPEITGPQLTSFLRDLCDLYDDLYRRVLRPNLNVPLPGAHGLTFGIDAGPLIPITVFGEQEYFGRVLNVACRLQGEVKVANEVLATKAVVNDYLGTDAFPSRMESVLLKNITETHPWECWRLVVGPNSKQTGRSSLDEAPPPKRAVKQIDAAQDWLGSLNSAFAEEVWLHGLKRHSPQVEPVGEYPLTEAQAEAARGERSRLLAEGLPNDPHAILADDPLWESDPLTIRVQQTDFAVVCALRAFNQKPPVLSSSAVIVCASSREVVLHERAKGVASFEGRIHTLGGAYMPPAKGNVGADRMGPRSTLQREVHEEAQLPLAGYVDPPILISKELQTGFFQVVYLGVPVSVGDLSFMQGNWEGNPIRISFDDLPSLLNNPAWVPSGKAHVLAWLALGAPNAGRSALFRGLSAKDLFFNNVARAGG